MLSELCGNSYASRKIENLRAAPETFSITTEAQSKRRKRILIQFRYSRYGIYAISCA